MAARVWLKDLDLTSADQVLPIFYQLQTLPCFDSGVLSRMSLRFSTVWLTRSSLASLQSLSFPLTFLFSLVPAFRNSLPSEIELCSPLFRIELQSFQKVVACHELGYVSSKPKGAKGATLWQIQEFIIAYGSDGK